MQKHGQADIFKYVYERAASGDWIVLETASRRVIESYSSEVQAISAVLNIMAQESVRHQVWVAPASKLDLV